MSTPILRLVRGPSELIQNGRGVYPRLQRQVDFNQMAKRRKERPAATRLRQKALAVWDATVVPYAPSPQRRAFQQQTEVAEEGEGNGMRVCMKMLQHLQSDSSVSFQQSSVSGDTTARLVFRQIYLLPECQKKPTEDAKSPWFSIRSCKYAL